MQRFTIRDIENLCNIKSHTFRMWEKRYNFFAPKRTTTGHRYYDNEDLKKLLRISFLYHNGWKISRIAELNEEAINKQVYEDSNAMAGHEQSILLLTEAAIDFDEIAFNEILEKAIRKFGFENCVIKVCYPFLTRIGLLWMTDHVIPAQEHFSSYAIQHKIIAAIDKLDVPAQKESIALFTPKNEFHELPLLFLHYLLKKNGWKTIYLGSNVTEQQLKTAADDSVPYLFLHLITNFTGYLVDDYLENLVRLFPSKTIVATGNALQDCKRKFPNVKLLYSDEQVLSFIKDPISVTRNS